MTLMIGREHGDPPRHKRPPHHHWVLGVLCSVAALVVVVVAVALLDDPQGSEAADRTTRDRSVTDSAAAGDGATGAGAAPARIGLDRIATRVGRMEAVAVSGRFGGRSGTALRVQLLERPEGWVDFPLPTVVDEAGRFRTYVELGRRGTSRIRVVDPRSGAVSPVATIRVR
jgi:hypothetical protein